MAHLQNMAAQLRTNPPLPPGIALNLSFTPQALVQSGFNFLVSISPSSLSKRTNPTAESKTVTVMAHFDTGASQTSIDTGLADYIGLSAVGIAPIHTAAGLVQMPNYAVDISFPNTNLASFTNLPISSCKLPFTIEPSGAIALNAKNFGILIGRDIMSRWNIVWNGPTSTVFVSD